MVGDSRAGGLVACFHPLKAYRKTGGGVTFDKSEGYVDLPSVNIPCGQCSGCRLQKSKDWTARCLHEAQLHEKNCFVTLTYDQANLPADVSLDIKHWQEFVNRLRHYEKFRYFHCGEYGDKNFRPHYHALLFGIDFFGDRIEWKKTKAGEPLYTSELLTKTWKKGLAVIGNLTPGTAAYVAKYCQKKLTGGVGKESCRRINTDTGEEYFVRSEYITMSRRPGIGDRWYEKFGNEVFPSDEVIIQGKKQRPPLYYHRKLDEKSETYRSVREKRLSAVANRRAENTPERLQVRETVQRARLGDLERKL